MNDAQARRRPNWARLGTELRRLRNQAGLSQDGLKDAFLKAGIRVSKATIERTEAGGAHGGSPPSVQRVMEWADACDAAHPDRAHLRIIAIAALDEHSPYRKWGSFQQIQEDVRQDEVGVKTLRNFDNWGIPGLLQTLDYAAATFRLLDTGGTRSPEEAALVRMRRQLILGDDSRFFEFLLTEEALRYWPRGLTAGAIRVQLDHLASAVSRPSVHFGVIPSGKPEMTAVPLIPFVLYEDLPEDGLPFAAIELLHERVEVRAPVDYATYRDTFDGLRESAVLDKDAVALVREIARSLPS
jgi:transcriptional regulator with XRE-family HTH domain